MKNNKILFGLVSIILMAVIVLMLFHSSTSTASAWIKPTKTVTLSPAVQANPGDVYIDNSRITIVVSPAVSNEPVISITPKTYTGPVDVVVGFNTSNAVPTGAFFNPHQEVVQKSYTCDGYFNYTINPKHFWCYKIYNQSDYHLVYEHDFDTGNLGSGTAYWNENKTVWNDISNAFSSQSYTFEGYNKWYSVKGFNVTAGQNYNLKLAIQPKAWDSYKYFFGIKPSGETLSQAIRDGHFYYIDPWTSSLNVNLNSYYTLNGTTGPVVESLGNFDGTNHGATRGVTGLINNSFTFDGSSYVSTSNSFNSSHIAANMWIKGWTSTTNSVFMSKAQKTTTSNGNWIFWFDASGKLAIYLRIDGAWRSATTTSIPSSSNWNQIGFSYNGSNLILVVNGAIVANTPYTGSLPSLPDFVYLGEQQAEVTPRWFYDGSMDEPSIWNRSLSLSEFQQLYNGGNGVTYSIPPTISLTYPSNATVTSDTSIDFNGTVTNVDNVTLFINSVANETNSSGFDGNYTFTKTLATGDYNWTYRACNPQECLFATNRTLSIDTTAPLISINSPANGTNYPYLLKLSNLTLNTTETDTHLSTCWYSYNNTNTSFSCSSGIPSLINLTLTNLTTVKVYANDSTGNMGYATSTWTYDVFDFNNYTFTASVPEATPSTFIGYFQTKNTLTSPKFFYNGTNYSTSATLLSGNIYKVKGIATAPAVTSNTNITWYYYIDNINTTSKNQTVTNIIIDDCSTYNKTIYNFTLYDEENPTTKLPNVTIDYGLNFYNSIRTVLIGSANASSHTNPTALCSNIVLSNPLSLDGSLKYYANKSTTSYTTKYYNFLNSTISNSTVPQNISLYTINSSKSLPFLLTFRDSNLVLYPHILVKINKQYLSSNDYKTVEIPITDTNGQAILNLVRNTAVYNLIMIDSTGKIVASFTHISAFCQDYTIGSCSIDLSSPSTVGTTYNYSQNIGISYSLDYSNTTKLISLTFNSINSSNANVLLKTTTENQFENQTVCSNSLLASSGTITCNVSSALSTNQFFFANIYVNGNLVDTIYVNTNPSNPNIGSPLGPDGFFIALLLMILIILLFSDDKQTLVIALVLGWAVVVLFGLVKGNLFGVISGGIWLFITALIFLWKLREEEGG